MIYSVKNQEELEALKTLSGSEISSRSAFLRKIR